MLKKDKLSEQRRAGSDSPLTGIAYLLLAAGIQYVGNTGFLNQMTIAMVNTVSSQSISGIPISETLNLEGKVGENGDNVVRLTTSYGVGTGILVNPYTLYTANHVITDATRNNLVPFVYIESQSYLGKGKSMKVDLTLENTRINPNSDLAMVTLAHPIYKANTVQVNKKYNPKQDTSVRAVCYRDRELVHSIGHVVGVFEDKPRYWITDINGGP